ncbi:hypothetical protein Pmar_PMAR004438 [Perkinsus marinus ATCC 50983]|uniref:Uncharacterized protein n=1 Tax=Perkinsus marinus (strain ATCC 50983 / TXsc) TaxID=423536 RepID=C5LZN3_PERM5|nr:hypothetical protein Pmar_PMAR004438 [Perkinsus marinus ATCC 50983]EEQ97701.1 hypothetical protein Pmar_PMAR004438 [Perkinsus marinus ATCC 50983]|eukprot:XP_002764984.1 hypothetical protein Pmar_PMAR004438 [Perkinsus marinus ATCC 50983]
MDGKKIEAGRGSQGPSQVKLQETDIIIGPFGSGLANVVYMRPGTQLVDFATTNHPFNPDFLAMARHSRVGYFCMFIDDNFVARDIILGTDMRQFPRNHEGGVVLPDELIRPLADEVMANYELERQRPQPRLQDPVLNVKRLCLHDRYFQIDLCDGGKNVFTQCKRPSGWHLADYQTVVAD